MDLVPWLMPVIPATQKAETGRIVVRDQTGEEVGETPHGKR
jgi:hypothetical protein